MTASTKTLTMFVGQSTTVDITAKLDDGSEETVTQDCEWISSDEASVTAAEGQIDASGAGKASVTATYESKKVKITVTVKPAIESLAIDTTNLVLTKGSTKTPKVYAIYGTGNNDKMDVTKMCEWESTDDDIAKVDSTSGKITAVSSGTATITGKFDPYEDGRFGSQAIVDVTVVPTIKSLAVDSTKVVLTAGQRIDFPVTAVFSDNTEEDVTEAADFKVANKSIAAYDNGGLTGLVSGKTTLTITYAGKKITVTVNVVANAIGISLSPETLPELTSGQVKNVKAKLQHSKGTLDVTDIAEWTSSNDSVASVVNGKITADSAGTAVITATYGSYTAQVIVAVDRTINTLSPSVTTTSANPLLLIKDDPVMSKQQISVAAIYNDNSQEDVTSKVTWKTSNNKVANVIQIGYGKYINAVGSGKATITGTTQGKSFTVNVKVTPAIQSIAVSESLIDLEVGNTKKLKVTATYSDNTTADVTSECTFTSGTPEVATVTGGTITPVAEGSAVITIAHTGASDVTAVVHVSNPVQQMSIFVDNVLTNYKTIPVLNQFTVVAKVKRSTSESAAWEVPTSGLTWLSSNNSVATVNGSGSVQGIAPGTAVITARYGTYVASMTVTVTNTLITSVSPSVKTQGTSFDLTISGTGTHFSTTNSLVYVGSQPVPIKSSSGATNLVVTVPDNVQAGKHNVRVITGTEDIILQESLTILQTLAVSSASTSTDGSTIEVLFNQSIKFSTGLTSATGANNFSLAITGGPASTVTGIAIKSGNDKVLTLTLDRAISNGSTITLTYNGTIVRNLAGDDFAAKPVTQTVVNATPDQQAPYFVSGATSTDGNTISLTFNESIALTGSDKKAGFSVNGSSTRIMGATIDATNSKVVVLTLSPLQPVTASEIVKISYSKVLGSYNVKDLAGNSLNDLTNMSVTNNVTTAASGPTGMTIESATLNVDGNLVLTGTLFTEGNAVDVTKIEIVDSDVWNGTPIALTSAGTTATINSASQITIVLGPNTNDLQGVLGPGVMLNARQGWLKEGSVASTDADIYGKPVTVTNALPVGMTITGATVYRYGADWSMELTGTNLNTQGGAIDIKKLTLTDSNGSLSGTSASYTFQDNDINTGGIAVNSGGTTATISLNSTGKTNLSTAIPNLKNGAGAGDSTVTLDAAAGWYKDAAGQAAVTGAVSGLVADVINPLEITGVASYDNSGDGMLDQIIITLSEYVKNTSTGTNNWTIKDANGASLTLGTITPSNNTLTISVTSSGYNTGKLTEVTYAADSSGDVVYNSDTIQNNLADVTVASTLISDNAVPRVVSRVTQDSATRDGKLDGVLVTFTEAMDASTITSVGFVITTATNGILTESYTDTTDDTTLLFKFTETTVDTDNLLKLQITAATLADINGNLFAAEGAAVAATDGATPVLMSSVYTAGTVAQGTVTVDAGNAVDPSTTETGSITFTNGATSDGNITITLDANAVNVAVINGDTTDNVATKAATALNNNATFSATYWARANAAALEMYRKNISDPTNVAATFGAGAGVLANAVVISDRTEGDIITTCEASYYFLANGSPLVGNIGTNTVKVVEIGASANATAANIATAIGTGSTTLDNLNATAALNVVTMSQPVADEDNLVDLSNTDADAGNELTIVAASQVAANATVAITFSEPMDTTTYDVNGEKTRITIGTKTMGTTVTMAWSNGNKTVTVDLDGNNDIAGTDSITAVNSAILSAVGETVDYTNSLSAGKTLAND
ncbi:MAG: Bacterial Ig-like domain (group 2) [Pelotomaculum sp. PtaU1.Bin035]|nr:MAG: Bacterial Ig-like domain (group 2) [Pelotomaculum sp. PtaU1.Bin035]